MKNEFPAYFLNDFGGERLIRAPKIPHWRGHTDFTIRPNRLSLDFIQRYKEVRAPSGGRRHYLVHVDEVQQIGDENDVDDFIAWARNYVGPEKLWEKAEIYLALHLHRAFERSLYKSWDDIKKQIDVDRYRPPKGWPVANAPMEGVKRKGSKAVRVNPLRKQGDHIIEGVAQLQIRYPLVDAQHNGVPMEIKNNFASDFEVWDYGGNKVAKPNYVSILSGRNQLHYLRTNNGHFYIMQTSEIGTKPKGIYRVHANACRWCLLHTPLKRVTRDIRPLSVTE